MVTSVGGPELRRAVHGMLAVNAATTTVAERAQLAYHAVYAAGYGGRGDLARFKNLTSASADTEFLAELARAVDDTVEIGVGVTHWDDAAVHVRYGALRATVPRRRFPADQLEPGRVATLRVRAVLPGRLPGFVVRNGRRSPSDGQVSRLYLNVRSAHAAWVLSPLATALDTADLPYEMKVLAHPRAYVRRDAAVVYVRTEDAGRAADVVRERIACDGIRLADPVPLLTRRLGPGVGFADEPDDVGPGLSHGQWVSRLLTASTHSDADADAILYAIRRMIVDAGRDPHQPHLRGEARHRRQLFPTG